MVSFSVIFIMYGQSVLLAKFLWLWLSEVLLDKIKLFTCLFSASTTLFLISLRRPLSLLLELNDDSLVSSLLMRDIFLGLSVQLLVLTPSSVFFKSPLKKLLFLP